MINGLKITEIPLVRMKLEVHKKKLKQISKRKFPLVQTIKADKEEQNFTRLNKSQQTLKNRSISLSLSQNKFPTSLQISESERLSKLKQNHKLKSYNYHRHKKQSVIEHENLLIFKKLLDIQERKDLNNPFARQNQINVQENEETKLFQKRNEKKININSNRKMAKDFVYRKKQSMAIQATNLRIGEKLMNLTAYYDHQKDIQNFNKTRQILNRLGKFDVVQRMMQNPKRSRTLPNKLPKLLTQQSQHF